MSVISVVSFPSSGMVIVISFGWNPEALALSRYSFVSAILVSYLPVAVVLIFTGFTSLTVTVTEDVSG